MDRWYKEQVVLPGLVAEWNRQRPITLWHPADPAKVEERQRILKRATRLNLTAEFSEAINASSMLRPGIDIEFTQATCPPHGCRVTLWSQSRYSGDWTIGRSYGAAYISNAEHIWQGLAQQNVNNADGRRWAFWAEGITPPSGRVADESNTASLANGGTS